MRQRADAKQLGEMVFGAVAMAYGGPTCKVHVIRGERIVRAIGVSQVGVAQ